MYYTQEVLQNLVFSFSVKCGNGVYTNNISEEDFMNFFNNERPVAFEHDGNEFKVYFHGLTLAGEFEDVIVFRDTFEDKGFGAYFYDCFVARTEKYISTNYIKAKGLIGFDLSCSNILE